MQLQTQNEANDKAAMLNRNTTQTRRDWTPLSSVPVSTISSIQPSRRSSARTSMSGEEVSDILDAFPGVFNENDETALRARLAKLSAGQQVDEKALEAARVEAIVKEGGYKSRGLLSYSKHLWYLYIIGGFFALLAGANFPTQGYFLADGIKVFYNCVPCWFSQHPEYFYDRKIGCHVLFPDTSEMMYSTWRIISAGCLPNKTYYDNLTVGTNTLFGRVEAVPQNNSVAGEWWNVDGPWQTNGPYYPLTTTW